MEPERRTMQAVRKCLGQVNKRLVLASLFVCASLVAALPAVAGATETETEKKVGEVASKVGEEGVVIVLAILTALIALIVAFTIIPKAVKMIKRFV
jgi:hypothetical protein